MSVDVEAMLGFGWVVQNDELTERFHELNWDDFAELEGKYGDTLGEKSVYDLVTVMNAYSYTSDYHIGVAVKPHSRVYEGEGSTDYRYRAMELPEFRESIDALASKVEPLKELFEDVMGYAPKTEPYFSLLEVWW